MTQKDCLKLENHLLSRQPQSSIPCAMNWTYAYRWYFQVIHVCWLDSWAKISDCFSSFIVGYGVGLYSQNPRWLGFVEGSLKLGQIKEKDARRLQNIFRQNTCTTTPAHRARAVTSTCCSMDHHDQDKRRQITVLQRAN
jgi:hypothetical protein